MAELLAGQPDHRRIDDRHHLFHMLEQQAIEKRFVLVLKVAQEDVLVEFGRLVAEGFVTSGGLFIETLDMRRQ